MATASPEMYVQLQTEPDLKKCNSSELACGDFVLRRLCFAILAAACKLRGLKLCTQLIFGGSGRRSQCIAIIKPLKIRIYNHESFHDQPND